MTTIFAAILFCILFPDVVSSATDTIPLNLAFRQGQFEIEPSYRDNAANIDNFIRRVNEIHADSLVTIRSIEITSFASPEGTLEGNRRLSDKRGLSTATYLKGQLPYVPDSAYHITSANINWNYLEQIVAQSDVMYKSEVLDVLRNVPESSEEDGVIVYSRLDALKNLHERQPYRYLYDNCFPILLHTASRVTCRYDRRTSITPPIQIVEYQPVIVKKDSIAEISEEIVADTVAAHPVEPVAEEWVRHAYIKTNLPAWLCLWTNVAGEIDVAPHWSVNLSIYYSGWNYFKRTVKFRTFAVMPELRYWPRYCNDGFFVGVHPGMAYYNFTLNDDYRYQDHDGKTPAWGGGISLGYRFALKRNPKWKFEASVGAGIYHLDYDLFDNITNGLLVGRRKRTFYGLDNVAFSVCYTFNVGKKGGEKK